jgi:hypothetical protein
MGIDPMNNITIIIRILFAVTLFQHHIGSKALGMFAECYGNGPRAKKHKKIH